MPIITKVVSSNTVHGEGYSIQHYVIKFVSDTNKTESHDITEILFKVALNTINQTCINIMIILTRNIDKRMYLPLQMYYSISFILSIGYVKDDSVNAYRPVVTCFSN